MAMSLTDYQKQESAKRKESLGKTWRDGLAASVEINPSLLAAGLDASNPASMTALRS